GGRLAGDGQAALRELGGAAVADAPDALEEVVPVLEFGLLALADDRRRDARADAADGLELGLRRLVGFDCGERAGGEQRSERGDELLEHASSWWWEGPVAAASRQITAWRRREGATVTEAGAAALTSGRISGTRAAPRGSG